jgi:hypothetical protein
MVDNGLWDVATEDCFSDVMLCIGCLENRIGGLLTKSDFSDVPLNTMNLVLGSARLRSRLTSV